MKNFNCLPKLTSTLTQKKATDYEPTYFNINYIISF